MLNQHSQLFARYILWTTQTVYILLLNRYTLADWIGTEFDATAAWDQLVHADPHHPALLVCWLFEELYIPRLDGLAKR